MERLTKPAVNKTGNKYVSAIGSSCGAWPRIIQRLAAYENTGLEPDDIRAFAEDVAHQFGYHSHQNGRLYLTHGGLSTLEWAFEILGWENPHPDPENECEIEGCHHYASCGTPTKDGYKRVCSHHFALIQSGKEGV